MDLYTYGSAFVLLLMVSFIQPLTYHHQNQHHLHLHHNKQNHTTLAKNSKNPNTELKITAFNGQLSSLKFDSEFYWQHGNECKIFTESPETKVDLSLKLFLAPSVFKATAVEKFKYFRTVLNAKQEKVTRLKSYSILFQIKTIFKYENQFDSNSLDNSGDAGQRTVFLSSQDEYSSITNLNSYLLVENFELGRAMTSTNGSNLGSEETRNCHSSTEIQLNKNYILFLNSQDTGVTVEKRKHFTHPIRIDGGININGKNKNQPLSHLVSYKSEAVIKMITKMAIFIKVPIFNLFCAPLQIDDSNYHDLESQIVKLACKKCLKSPVLKLNKTTGRIKHQMDAKLICSFEGNPMPVVFWQKFSSAGNELISRNSTLFKVYSYEHTSTLEIGQVVYQSDPDKYACFAYDFIEHKFVIVAVTLFENDQSTTTTTSSSKSITTATIPTPNNQFSTRVLVLPKNPTTLRAASFKPSIITTTTSTITITTITTTTTTTQSLLSPKITLDPSPSQKRTLIGTFKTASMSPVTTPTTTTSTTNKQLAVSEEAFAVTSSKKPNQIKRKQTKKYVYCNKSDDTCVNGGICYTTNPVYYSNSGIEIFNKAKIKFCICQEFYEGPNCEVSLVKKIIYDPAEIPSEFNEVWTKAGIARPKKPRPA